MAYFSNRTVNYLNLHLALVNLLDQSFTVFGPVYFYTQGFSIAGILGLLALMNLLRMPLRFLSFPVIQRFGIKYGVMIGASGYSLTFPLLGMVTGNGPWLWLYVMLYATFNAMHWFCFHVFYSLAGEHEKRGRQIAAAYALSVSFNAISPFLSALIIALFGFAHYFMLALCLAAVMLLTVSRTTNIPVPRTTCKDAKNAVFTIGTGIHLMESAASYPMNICWLFAIYLYVGKLLSLGGILTFGAIVQALYQLALGAWVDKGHGNRITYAATALRGLAVIGKTFMPLSVVGILGVEAVAAAGAVHNAAVEPTVLYNAGKRSKHTVAFWLLTEMAWDAGTGIGAGGAAFLLWNGVGLRQVIFIAFPFLLGLWWLLHGYFSKQNPTPG